MKEEVKIRVPSGRRVLAGINDERLRTALTVDKVTEHLENAFGVRIAPRVLYQGLPQFFPAEVLAYFASKKVVQRDMFIAVFDKAAGATKTILLARSWINVEELDGKFREALYGGEMTIGQIIRELQLPVHYQTLGYRKVRSSNLAEVFGARGTVRLIQRSRVIHSGKIPLIFIHEFVPE